MKLFDFFRFRKKKNTEPEAVQPIEDPAVTPLEFDPAEIQTPDSRFTEEYQAFLEAQEAKTLPENDEASSQSGTEPD